MGPKLWHIPLICLNFLELLTRNSLWIIEFDSKWNWWSCRGSLDSFVLYIWGLFGFICSPLLRRVYGLWQVYRTFFFCGAHVPVDEFQVEFVCRGNELETCQEYQLISLKVVSTFVFNWCILHSSVTGHKNGQEEDKWQRKCEMLHCSLHGNYLWSPVVM